MNNTYLVSIIIPVYNAEKYLRNCIDSILRQSYKTYEIILINDGSNDHSGKICDRYSKKHNNIKTVHISNNGPSHARNIGIKHAKGDWICFVDSDDTVSPDWLKTYMNNAYADLLIQGYRIKEKENEKTISINKDFVQEDNIFILSSKLSEEKFCGLLNSPIKCFRSDIIKKNKIYFKQDIHLGEDLIFVLEFIGKAKSILTIPYEGYIYNTNNSTLTKRYYKIQDIIDWNDIIVRTVYKICKGNKNNILYKSITTNQFSSRSLYITKFYDRTNYQERKEFYKMLRSMLSDIKIKRLRKSRLPFLLCFLPFKLFDMIVACCAYLYHKK